MAKKDVLKRNQNIVASPTRNKGFYALVDVKVDENTRTVVIEGVSRSDAERNALTEIEVNGWKAKISGIYPISA